MSGTTPSWSHANVVPRAAEARLDLVGHHQHCSVSSHSARTSLEEALRRDDHAALALDRLEQHGDRGVVDGGRGPRRCRRTAPSGSPGVYGA